MPKYKPFDIEIDKLTRSIENAITGDRFNTQILELTPQDIKSFRKADWLFDWKAEAKQSDKTIYKLVMIIQKSFRDLSVYKTGATTFLCR